jgi:hypothetical protein
MVSSSRSGEDTASNTPCSGSWLKSSPAVPKARSRSDSTTSLSKTPGHRPGAVMRDGRGAAAALDADETDRAAERFGLRVGIEIADGADQLKHADGVIKVFADAAVDQVAVKRHVVDVADHDHLGARVAIPRRDGRGWKSGRSCLQAVSTMIRFGVGAVLESLDGSRDAALVDLHMRLGHAPVFHRRSAVRQSSLPSDRSRGW